MFNRKNSWIVDSHNLWLQHDASPQIGLEASSFYIYTWPFVYYFIIILIHLLHFNLYIYGCKKWLFILLFKHVIYKLQYSTSISIENVIMVVNYDGLVVWRVMRLLMIMIMRIMTTQQDYVYLKKLFASNVKKCLRWHATFSIISID